MTHKFIAALAFIVALSALAPRTAFAAPMLCSGEEKTCLAACVKFSNQAYVANCVTNCRASGAYCMHTGCWANGSSRYCGILRK
jgi:hypothetical protein